MTDPILHVNALLTSLPWHPCAVRGRGGVSEFIDAAGIYQQEE